MLKKVIFISNVLAFGISAQGDPVDLSSWSAIAHDYSGGQPADDPVLSGGGTPL